MRYTQTDEHGYVVGEFDARESPREPGNFHYPRGSVVTPPPVVGAEQAPRWRNGAWEIVPDLRGRVYWLPDGSRHEITERGVDLPADALNAAPPPTQGQVIADLTSQVQAHLDATARTRNYDGILSLCSYATSPHPTFGPEGLAGVAWRDAVWAACYAILDGVQAGTRTAPTAAELLAELPAMVWPA